MKFSPCFRPPNRFKPFLRESLSPGINPPLTVDLVLIKVTLGFLFKINLLTILGILLGIYLYKNI